MIKTVGVTNNLDLDVIPDYGTPYTGTTNTTSSGLTCQMWSVTTPHNHDYSDVGEHNYCRDPDGEGMLWCYTMDPGTEWEACNVMLGTQYYTGI